MKNNSKIQITKTMSGRFVKKRGKLLFYNSQHESIIVDTPLPEFIREDTIYIINALFSVFVSENPLYSKINKIEKVNEVRIRKFDYNFSRFKDLFVEDLQEREKHTLWIEE